MLHPRVRALALFDDYLGLSDQECASALEALKRPDPELHAALLAMLIADRQHCLLDDGLFSQARSFVDRNS